MAPIGNPDFNALAQFLQGYFGRAAGDVFTGLTGQNTGTITIILNGVNNGGRFTNVQTQGWTFTAENTMDNGQAVGALLDSGTITSIDPLSGNGFTAYSSTL